jgi:hypothetical protein
VEKVWCRKGSSFDEEAQADRDFWLQMTGRERVEALEEMRKEAWKAGGERFEGLRRVARVVKLPRS